MGNSWLAHARSREKGLHRVTSVGVDLNIPGDHDSTDKRLGPVDLVNRGGRDDQVAEREEEH
jgi:hypothetical protein